MALDQSTFAIGLTAPFGSGCTTAAQILSDRLGYYPSYLSDGIKATWFAEHPGQEPTRSDLQETGNLIRRKMNDAGALARGAISALEKLEGPPLKRVVFDALRNPGEFEALRDRFGMRFFVIAIECRASDRWGRLSHLYNSVEEFSKEDERDRDQEVPYGQQVAHCVDQADVLLDNSDDVSRKDFRRKLEEHAELVTGVK